MLKGVNLNPAKNIIKDLTVKLKIRPLTESKEK